MTEDKSSAVPWIISAAVLLVYLCFPTKVYYWDGVAFAQMIEDAPALGASLIHPNHLFYEAFGYLVYKAVRGVGIEVRALVVLQVMSSFSSAAAAFVLFQTLRLTVRSLYLCIALTCLFAFSATWWKFSTDANAYVPSVLFMLVSFYLILPARRPRPLLLAVMFTLSMLLHQLAVFCYPVLALGLFWQDSTLEPRRRVRVVLQFSAVAFAVTFGAYYYSFYLTTNSLDFRRLLSWMTSFSPDVSFSFDAVSNLSYTLRGHWRLFFGGRFNALKGLVNPFIVGLFIVLAATVVLFLAALVRGLKSFNFRRLFPPLEDRLKTVALVAALWFALYTVFLFVWLPHNTFYRLFYLPALILLAGIFLAGKGASVPRRTYRLALLVGVIGLCNFLFLIYPYSYIGKYPPLALALEMNQVWPRGTVIYYASENSDISLFRYFNPPTVWMKLNPAHITELESELRNIYSRGGTAWLDVTAIEQLSNTTEGTAWLAAHAVGQSRRELVDRAYKIKFVQIAPG